MKCPVCRSAPASATAEPNSACVVSPDPTHGATLVCRTRDEQIDPTSLMRDACGIDESDNTRMEWLLVVTSLWLRSSLREVDGDPVLSTPAVDPDPQTRAPMLSQPVLDELRRIGLGDAEASLVRHAAGLRCVAHLSLDEADQHHLDTQRLTDAGWLDDGDDDGRIAPGERWLRAAREAPLEHEPMLVMSGVMLRRLDDDGLGHCRAALVRHVLAMTYPATAHRRDEADLLTGVDVEDFRQQTADLVAGGWLVRRGEETWAGWPLLLAHHRGVAPEDGHRRAAHPSQLPEHLELLRALATLGVDVTRMRDGIADRRYWWHAPDFKAHLTAIPSELT